MLLCEFFWEFSIFGFCRPLVDIYWHPLLNPFNFPFFSIRKFETKMTNYVSSARPWRSKSTTRSSDDQAIENDRTVRRSIGMVRFFPTTRSLLWLSGIRKVWRHRMSPIPLTIQTVRVFLLCESAVMAGQMKTRVSCAIHARAKF